MEIVVGAAQIDCVLGDREANLLKAQDFVDRAAEQGVKLLLFPELFSTGYDLRGRVTDFAEDDEGPTVQFLLKNAKQYDMTLAGSCIEKNPDGKPFNTMFLAGPNGPLGKHHKVQLWAEENDYYTPGETFEAFDTPLGKMGMMICYDADFPEAARALAMQGAEIFLFSTAGTPLFDRFYDNFIASRSFENSCFLIQANRSGREGDIQFAGYSKIVHPNGDVLENSGRDEALVVTKIDLSDVQKTRDKIPYMKDFKPHIYKKYYG